MIIRRAQVSHYRCLADPIEVTFAPGLNVIHGPNETGKTTLLRALRDGLTLKARQGGARLNAMLTRGNTEPPTVELELEHDGAVYVVRKVFRGADGRAVLTKQAEQSSEELRDDAAEAALRAVLGVRDYGRQKLTDEHLGIWPLLWIEQGASARDPAHDLTADGREQLTASLEAIAGEAAAGSNGRALETRVQAHYEQYFTPTGRAIRAAEAPLRQAELELETAERELQQLHDRESRYHTTVEDYARTRDEVAQLEAQLPSLHARRDDAAKARDEIERLQRDVERARADAARRQTTLQHIEERIAHRAKLRARSSELERASKARQERIQQLLTNATTAGERLKEANQTLASASETEAHARATATAYTRRARWSQGVRELKRHEQHLAEAHTLAAEQDRCTRALERLRVDRDALRELETLDRERQVAEARVHALGALVELTAERNVELELDGKTLALDAGATQAMPISETRTLRVPGVIRVSIRPGGDDLDTARATAAKTHAALAAQLKRLGVPDMNAARASAAQHEEYNSTLARLRARLTDVAPAGIEALSNDVRSQRAESERLAAQLTESDRSRLLTDDEAARVEAEAARAQERLAQARATRDQAATTDRDARSELERERANLAADGRAIEQLQRDLSDHEAAYGSDESLDDERRVCASALRDAERAARSSEEALALRDPPRIRAECERAESGVRRLEARLAEQQRALHQLQGALQHEDVIGLADRIDAAQTEHARRAAVVAARRREANATRLLHETLERHRAASVARYVAPLEQAARPMLRALFPEFELEFSNDLSLSSLQRASHGKDTFDSLSQGTREQLGLALRLALSRLLARETRLCVMLDDALVASDTPRFDAFVQILKRAADDMQIILATCHWERYLAVGIPHEVGIDLARLRS